MADIQDAEAIRSSITRLLHAIDRRRWEELAGYCSAIVETDYRQLFGGDVQRQPAGKLIAQWRRMLAPLTATQHLLGPIDVQVAGPDGAAQCHVRGYHHLAGPSGTQEWMVAGHYRFALENTPDGWKIAGITLELFYQTGNSGLLDDAAAATGLPSR